MQTDSRIYLHLKFRPLVDIVVTMLRCELPISALQPPGELGEDDPTGKSDGDYN